MAAPAKRATTAYFLFSEEKRAEAREECLAEGSVEKISVATVAKRIGEKWRALSEDEKAIWKELAVKKAAEMASQQQDAAAEQPQEGDEPGSQTKKRKADATSGPPGSLPVTVVKRIMCMDADVNRVSGDAVALVAKATCLFLEALGGKAMAVARQNKRRTIKFSDVDRAVHLERKLVDMGLSQMLATEDIFAEARGDCGPGKENGEKGAAGAAKAASKANDAKGTRTITSFFTA